MKLVSVIVTTYKRPQYLKECLESIYAQSLKEIEVVLVNDDPAGGNTDSIAAEFRDKNLVYIKNERNLGGAKSLNVGLSKAVGEYIAILDDDDSWIDRDKLRLQTEFLEANPDYVIVGTNCVTVGNTGKEISRGPSTDNVLICKSGLFNKAPFAHSSVLFRRGAAVAIGGYDERLARGKDLDFYFRISEKGRLAYLSSCCVKYREVNQSERDIFDSRLRDTGFLLKVLWKNRDLSDVNLYRGLSSALMRLLVFKTLQIFPSLYYWFRRAKYRAV